MVPSLGDKRTHRESTPFTKVKEFFKCCTPAGTGIGLVGIIRAVIVVVSLDVSVIVAGTRVLAGREIVFIFHAGFDAYLVIV